MFKSLSLDPVVQGGFDQGDTLDTYKAASVSIEGRQHFEKVSLGMYYTYPPTDASYSAR